MSMLDFITVKNNELPYLGKDIHMFRFQTRDTPSQGLQEYTIDGRHLLIEKIDGYWEESGVSENGGFYFGEFIELDKWMEHCPFTGTIKFHTSMDTRCKKYIEYEASFIDGELIGDIEIILNDYEPLIVDKIYNLINSQYAIMEPEDYSRTLNKIQKLIEDERNSKK